MPKLAKLKYDTDTCCHTCKHKLGGAKVDVVIDASEEAVDLQKLTEVAQLISDGWATRHQRLAKFVADELVSNDYISDVSLVSAAECIPFSLRVYADPDCEISYTIAFNVPSVLDDDDEYVDVEEEINAEWINTEVCSTE